MAAVNYPKYSTGETTTIERAVDEKIVLVDIRAAPLLKRVSPNLNNLPVTLDETKLEWMDDSYHITSTTLQAAQTSTTKTTFTVKAADGEYILKGMILEIDDEQVVVTTKGTASDVVKAARGYGGTTGATHAINSTAEIVGRVHLEGGDATDDSYIVATLPYNYTQIWQAEFEVTSTEQSVKRYGDVNDIDYLEDKALVMLMRLMNRQIYHGKRVERTSTSALANAGAYGGLTDTSAAYVDSGNITDKSSAALVKDDIMSTLRTMFGAVGAEFMPTLLVCGAWAQKKIDDMFDAYIRTTRDESRGGHVITSLVTPFTELEILLDPYCQSNYLYLLNESMISLGPLQGQQFRTVKLAQTTALKDKWQIVGEYSMCIKGPETHGYIHTFSTSS